jgi:hypothetical protein
MEKDAIKPDYPEILELDREVYLACSIMLITLKSNF